MDTPVPNQDAMTLAPRDASTPADAQTIPPDASAFDPSRTGSGGGQAPTPRIPGYEILGCMAVVEKHDKVPAAERQSLAKSYADRAITHLQDATEKGFKNAERLRNDADLAPLRERDDFKKLTKELMEKSNAGKK